MSLVYVTTSQWRDGKLGKRFSTCVDHPLNSIVDCEGNDCSLAHQGDNDFERLLDNDENLVDDDILLLTETDIPGASLDGKHPSELSVVTLTIYMYKNVSKINFVKHVH